MKERNKTFLTMTFKSLSLLLLLFSTLFLAPSCGLLDDAVPDIVVKVDGSEIIFNLPEANAAGVFTLTNVGLPSDVAAKLADENVDQSRAKSAKLSAAVFRIATEDAPVDFSVIDRVKLTITSPGFGSVTLADDDFSDLVGRTVNLEVADAELLDHLLTATADFELTVTTNAAIPEVIDLAVRPEFEVTASPL